MKRRIVFVGILPVVMGISCGHELFKPLNTKIIGENLCIFTNESKKNIKNGFLVHIGKVEFTKEYKSEYSQHYDYTELPTSKKNCAYIPLNKIEKNTAYWIVLSTSNQTYNNQICIVEKENQPTIHYVAPGESTCN